MLSWSFFLRHWRTIALAVGLLAILAYVRSAEKAKSELAGAKARAEVAEQVIAGHLEENAVLSGQIETLKDSVAESDRKYQEFLRRQRRNQRPEVVLVPDTPPDTTGEAPADTNPVPILEHPVVKEALSLCEKRVSTRDALLRLADIRHRNDSTTIAHLRNIVNGPVDPAPPAKPASTLSKVLYGAVVGGLSAVAANSAAGGKGDVKTVAAVGVSVGGLIGLFRK